jgi:hypothetical protein
MKTTKVIIEELQAQVQNSKLATKFSNKEPIAHINGPAVVIETIVQKASLSCNIDMDWSYSGGRGVIYADGDAKVARRELFLAMPESDLTIRDL